MPVSTNPTRQRVHFCKIDEGMHSQARRACSHWLSRATAPAVDLVS